MDEIREQNSKRQLRKQSCLYSSSGKYGSNTAQCQRENKIFFLILWRLISVDPNTLG